MCQTENLPPVPNYRKHAADAFKYWQGQEVP
jgi:hypothetical protein